ncbi:MAG: hypothetical protein ISQ08_10235 [Planctomycetes bacterium]|nr:hypothetical protein [Planctomycetota bacterium]
MILTSLLAAAAAPVLASSAAPAASLLSASPLLSTSPTALTAPALQDIKKGFHANPKFGFQFSPPKGWNNIALKTDEAFLGAKYTSDKTYYWTDPRLKTTSTHTPELMVICFAREDEEGGKARRKEEDDGTVTYEIVNPYKNHEEFLEKTVSSGFYRDSTEEDEVNGVKVTKNVYICANGATEERYRYLVAWVFHGDGIDYAIQMDALVDEYKGLKRTIERTLKSFELIERTGEDIASAQRQKFVSFTDMNKGDAKERKTKRVESESWLRTRAVESMPPDWEQLDVDGVLILSHTDPKTAKRFGEHVSAMYAWFDKTFEYVGKGQYVRMPILRVCADREERFALGRGVRDGEAGGYTYDRRDLEIYLEKPEGGWIGSEIDQLNERLLWLWFSDRDWDVFDAMPGWLQSGLQFVVRGARPDGRKMEFRDNDADRINSKQFQGQDLGITPREMLLLKQADYNGPEANRYLSQATAFVRYLLSPDARRDKLAKDFLESYLLALKEVTQEVQDKYESELNAQRGPETEEEEEQMMQRRREIFQRSEAEILEGALEKAFAKWDEKDWDKLNETFTRWL